MADNLNVIALISGGKDSLYSLLHCIQHGHNVVALANLYPPSPLSGQSGKQNVPTASSAESEAADINSFMYQTVGHSVIPLYSEALGIPLYRREITGSAVITDRYYTYAATSDYSLDETEELVPLLQQILRSHPEANAISSGAIQSTYQRTRIESVALRLGLIPLAYLWQYPNLPPPSSRNDTMTGLLEDMAAAGCDARIIKIASGGINERLLWENVASTGTAQRLINGLSPFFDQDEAGLRGAVVGEGGEYETLALSGPQSVWKNGFIVVDVDQNSVLPGEGGISYVKLERARVEHEDEKKEVGGMIVRDLVRVPTTFDPLFQDVRDRISSRASRHPIEELPADIVSSSKSALFLSQSVAYRRAYCRGQNSVQITNINVTSIFPTSDPLRTLSAVEQMKTIGSYLVDLLTHLSTKFSISPSLSTASIVHSILLLRSIDAFSTINPVYASLFRPGVPNPPARVTVAAPLPLGVDVSLSVIVDLGPQEAKKGLHVQSRSYWAPANIGPYSQAICIPLRYASDLTDDFEASGDTAVQIELCHMAGQIPLLPNSMEIFGASFADQAALSLQHLWRVGQERGVDVWSFGVALLAQVFEPAPQRLNERLEIDKQSALAAKIWTHAHHHRRGRGGSTSDDDNNHSTDEEVDIWHLQYNRSMQHQRQGVSRSSGGHLHQLPMTTSSGCVIPAFLAVEMSALPRHAQVEWWSLGIIGISTSKFGSRGKMLDLVVENTDDYVLSTLTIASRVKLVAYMIRSLSEQRADEPLKGPRFVTVSDIIKHTISHSATNSFELATGTAFVSTSSQGIWNEFCANESPQTPQDSSHVLLDPVAGGTLPDYHVDLSSHLGDAVSVVPCYRIWGHGGQATTDVAGGHGEPVLKEFAVAFLFRFDAL